MLQNAGINCYTIEGGAFIPADAKLQSRSSKHVAKMLQVDTCYTVAGILRKCFAQHALCGMCPTKGMIEFGVAAAYLHRSQPLLHASGKAYFERSTAWKRPALLLWCVISQKT